MEKKIQEAARLHQQGFNCAQAVALPFCEELGMDRAAAMRALEGFGAGMGGRTMACGALSGAVFVAGLKHSDGNLEAPASKQRTYAASKAICDAFVAHCGASACEDILGLKTGTPLIGCPACIELGVRLAYQTLAE